MLNQLPPTLLTVLDSRWLGMISLLGKSVLSADAWRDPLSVGSHSQPFAFIKWQLCIPGELPELRRGGADLQAEPDPSIHASPPALAAPASPLRGHKSQL